MLRPFDEGNPALTNSELPFRAKFQHFFWSPRLRTRTSSLVLCPSLDPCTLIHASLIPQVPLPGGYKIGDVVYSLVKETDETEPIDVGSKGIVQGPCRNMSAAEFDQRVLVDFGDGIGGLWDMLVTNISKTDPTKVHSTPTS